MSRPDHGSQAVRSLHTAGIREVAAAANVSTATVSRALRGLPRVSAATRQKVMAAANNLGYVASAAASELARGRGSQDPAFSRGTILVVLGPESRSGHTEQGSSSHAHIKQLVQSVASAHGFTVSVESFDEAGTADAVRMAGAPVAGIIITSGSLEYQAKAELREALASTLVPSVEIQPGGSRDRDMPTHTSLLSSACTVVISGAGTLGYKLAIEYLAQTSTNPGEGEPAGSGSPAP